MRVKGNAISIPFVSYLKVIILFGLSYESTNITIKSFYVSVPNENGSLQRRIKKKIQKINIKKLNLIQNIGITIAI